MSIKLSDKLWIVKNQHVNQYGDLVYMTYDSGDSAFDNRKQTGINWATQSYKNFQQREVESLTIDNSPVNGVVIKGVVTRYSTSNRLFTMVDPRGFEIQVAVEQLFDLMQHCDISKGGVINDEIVWGFEAANIKPIVVGSVVYDDVIRINNESANMQFVSYRDLKYGDHVYFKNDSATYVYIGRLQYDYGLRITEYNRGTIGQTHHEVYTDNTFRHSFIKAVRGDMSELIVNSDNKKITSIEYSNPEFTYSIDQIRVVAVSNKINSMLSDFVRVQPYARLTHVYLSEITISSCKQEMK